MRTWVLPIAADLKYEGGQVIVGPESKRVLDIASQVANAHPTAQVYLPAEWSEHFGVTMGSGPMRDHLLRCNMNPDRIKTEPQAFRFNTIQHKR